jgi:hypothetical protein
MTDATEGATRDAEDGKGIHSPFNACMFRDECRRRDEDLARAVAAERERCALQLQYAPLEAFARDYAAILRATPAGAEGGVV